MWHTGLYSWVVCVKTLTSECDLLNVFLFSWWFTNSSGEQPSSKNWQKVPLEKLPNLRSYLNVNDVRLWLALKGLELSLIGYTSTSETAVCHSDWLYRPFSHVKIERIDFYKSALWNKIVVLCVVKMRVKLELFRWKSLSVVWVKG